MLRASLIRTSVCRDGENLKQGNSLVCVFEGARGSGLQHAALQPPSSRGSER